MDPGNNKQTKGLLCSLKYLKLWKRNNTSNTVNVSNRNSPKGGSAQNNANVVVFRRNLTANSLDEMTPLRRSGSQLRKSLRKWHRRMKNCFSKNGHVNGRQITICPAPAASDSRVVLSSTSVNRENIYSLDPLSIERETKSPLLDQTTDTTISPLRYMTRESGISAVLDERGVSVTGSVPRNDVSSLAHCVWYWGPASRVQVEAKLAEACDGSFLVRDSSSDRYIFSISFRSVGITLHSRIEFTSRSGYKLFDHDGYSSVKELIEQAMEVSRNGIYCYTKNRAANMPNYPVRLTNPISRYEEVRSLQNLSRFVIRQYVNLNDIDKLCLPIALRSYLKEEMIY
ncbi:uncharacterized protein LOC132698787 [Cylas formicarius]|uniref:uncharacterized protein LOC132698787 n=1 Tax=Cylas formicarius TaxID=197179 RepID=UPI0029583F43|nr:uncharacterized protein LOC132698787 [Cylas formicarius]XP_060521032.1 uncharacterized protein LOC132698787 [Cylas formicarius]